MQTTRALTFAALAAASAAWVGCTFGGLANYAIDTCDPGATTQAGDACDRLNKDDPRTCTPYQCDPASHHCVAKPRDDDRDGDPAQACGGTDCDDADPLRSGRATEKCDGLDNDCNGLVDEDALGPLGERIVTSPGALTGSADPSLGSADQTNIVAAYVSSTGEGTCIPLVQLQHGAGQALGTGCYLLAEEPALVPHQPFAVAAADGAGAAFVSTGSCAAGRLAYRFHANQSAGFELPCDPQHPAALPALSAMPPSANGKSGVVAWLEVPLGDRGDPVSQCASVKPAPLAVAYVGDLTSPGTVAPSSVIRSSEATTATRPPALVPIDAVHGVVMAAPYGADVGVWLLTPTALVSGALPASTHIAGLAGAHEVALATRTDGASVSVAIVAVRGCHPAASISLVLGTLDAGGTFRFGEPVEVAATGDVATLPSAAWVSARGGEWWTAWISAGGRPRIRRVGRDGKPIGSAIDVGKQLVTAAVTTDGSAFGFDPAAAAGSFVEIPVGCSPSQP